MKSINFVLLGDSGLAAELGKKGTSTDLAIYDRKSADTVYTWTTVVTYPEKIQPLLQAISIGEYAILNVTKIDKFLGEQIMALDAAGPKSGFIIHSYEIDHEKLKTLAKDTSLSNYIFVESIEQLKSEMAKVSSLGAAGPLTISTDHAFDVKGVGTVVLGVVRRGLVKAYDNLELLPQRKTILVKSIQMHDDPVAEAASPARVGLAIKGADADEIARGDILCSPGSVSLSGTTLMIQFSKSRFFKGDLPENHTYLLSVGAQIRSVKIKVHGEGKLELTVERPIAFVPGQNCTLLKPDSPSTRIIGRGEIIQG